MRYSIARWGCALPAMFLGLAVSAAHGAAERIFINARAYTLDAGRPWAEAVAVEDGRIAWVGDNAGALALADAATAVHDLGGRMLLPGFIDTHIHPLSGGFYTRVLSLDPSGGVQEWQRDIAQYARENPGGGLLFGYGFLASTFGADGPHRRQLDAVVPDRPVLIMDEGFHGAWANSRALAALGIDRDTPDPVPGFSYYRRDAGGEATGYLLEGTADLAMQALGVVDLDAIVSGSTDLFAALNSYGVTALFDAHEADVQAHLVTALDQLARVGAMTLRIVGSYKPAGPGPLDGAVATTLRWADAIRGERYQYRVLKLMLDGTVEGRTAAMFEDYQGEPGNAGELVYSQAQISAVLAEAAAAGIDVHMHAIGERAVNQALNGVEAARAAHPDSPSRYTISHVEVIADADLQRFADLGVIAQSTPLWASYDTYGEPFVSADQFSRFWRYRSLAELGVRLTWGSDFPASGYGMPGASPLMQMEVGITRQEPGEPNAPVQPRESERMDLAGMLRGYTLDAAWQLHLEDELGSLEVGKRADLVVLEENLFEVPVYSIHGVEVVATYLDGQPVYGSLPLSPGFPD